MNILIAFYSKTGRTEQVALALQRFFAKEHKVTLFKVKPVDELKASMYKKSEKDLPLADPLLDVQAFDLVLIGTPVWGFCPSPIIVSYLRKLQNVKGKRFALFATCTVLPGTTIKRMGNIIATAGATVVDSLTIKSIFELDSEKLRPAEKFAQKLVRQL